MDLEICIDEKTKTWLRKKGGKLSVHKLKAKGCWGAGPVELFTQLGKPKEETGYHAFQIDDLTIYVQKNLKFKDDRLTLKLSGFSIFTFIAATGISRFS